MSSVPEEQVGRLRRARVIGWITLGAFAVVVVVSLVLAARGTANPLLLIADLLCVVIAIRTLLRLRAVTAALRDLEE